MKVNPRDLIWSYLAKFLTVGINVVLLPVVMHYLTEAELGLWYVFSSVSQIVYLFDFGFNSTIARHMTYAWMGAEKLTKEYVTEQVRNEKNSTLISNVVVTCRMVYFIISIMALLLLLTVGTAYISYVAKNDMNISIKWSWFIYAIAVFLNLFYGYWSSLLQGIGAVAERNKLSVYSKIMQIVIAFFLLKNGFGLLGFVIAYAISGITIRIIGKGYFKRKTTEVELRGRISISDFKETFLAMWSTSWKDGVVMIAQYISTQANTLIAAYYIDLAATSVYGVLTQIMSLIGSLGTAYYSAYQPAYSAACLHRDVEQQRKIVYRSSFVYKLIYSIGMIGFLCAGIPILKVLRPQMNVNIYMTLLVGIFYYLFNQHSMFASIIAGSNRILYYKEFVLSSLASFILALILTRSFRMGVWGIISAQILVNLAYNNWKWPAFVFMELNMSYKGIFDEGINFIRSIGVSLLKR